MADQTNPWGSAPSTDSAAQAADAWGGASTAAPANGGGADWLHSAPAPPAGTVQYHGSVP